MLLLLIRKRQKSGYGQYLEEQRDKLEKAKNEVENLQVWDLRYKRWHTTLQPWQKGIIGCCNALPMLHESLCNQYDVSYILTARLNQDALENFVCPSGCC